MGPLWSVSVEEQFYICFPFLVFFFSNKSILKLSVGFIIIGVTGRALLYLHNSEYLPFSSFNTVSCLDSLGVGSILGFLSLYKMDYLKKIIGNRFLFAGAVFIFLAVMIGSFSIYSGNAGSNFTSVVFMRLFFNVMSFWILGWAVVFGYKGFFKKVLENSVVVYLGRISYGMYLYHLFVPQFIAIIFHHFKVKAFSSNNDISSVCLIIIYVTVTILISSVSWFLVEKPLNNFKKYFSYYKTLELAK